MNTESEDTHALIVCCSDYSHKRCSFSFKLPGKQVLGKEHVLNKMCGFHLVLRFHLKHFFLLL